MKVQSTGLGKTLMEAGLDGIRSDSFEGRKVLLMTMEAYKPLHWTIKVHLEPADVRRALFLGLKPALVWKVLMALFFGRYSLFPRREDREAVEAGPGETAPLIPAAAQPAPAAASDAASPGPAPARKTRLPGILAPPDEGGSTTAPPPGPAAPALAPGGGERPRVRSRLPGVLAHPDEDEG
ncbi:MAG: hypothetical protein AB1896_00340 [Thermodesulfobacteriota bacterium]